MGEAEPATSSRSEPTRVWLGRDCFVVAAERLPPGINQRPGVTLLLGRRAPLTVELLEHGVRTGWAFLLAPEPRVCIGPITLPSGLQAVD